MTDEIPPSQEELTKAFFDLVERVAAAWVSAPDGIEAQRVLMAREKGRLAFSPVFDPGGAKSEALGWGLGAILLHAISLGDDPLPGAENQAAAALLEIFKWDASAALARLCINAIGLDPRAASDAVSAGAAAAAAGTAMPEELVPIEDWLVAHWGGVERRAALGRFLGVELRGAFISLALDRAEQREAEARARRFPTLRRGTAFMRTLLTTERHVVDAVRRAGGKIAPTDAEFRRLFKYQPLGAAERLVMHALASHARDIGMLNAHPWATASGAMPKKPGEEPPRVRIPYPGTSEIARILGYADEADGKISRARRTTIEGAIKALTSKPRWIAMRVLLPPARKGGEWIEDTEVRQELWITASATVMTRGIFLNLHPAAIASHLKSFQDIPDLAARYDAARDALGAREMRDEWAIADEYLRYLALSITAHAHRKGATVGEMPAVSGSAAGDITISKRLTYETLVSTLGLSSKAKKQGRPWARERIKTALHFCEEMGSVRSFDDTAPGVYDLALPYPDSATVDDDQLLILAPDLEDSPN